MLLIFRFTEARFHPCLEEGWELGRGSYARAAKGLWHGDASGSVLIGVILQQAVSVALASGHHVY